jgi:dipeptidyl aminopeptidase/acylaminoacyl peptidase
MNPRRLSGSYDSGMTRAPVLAVVLCGVAFAGSPSSWTPELSMKVQEVSDVVPSPNGEWVVYAQTRAVMEEEKSETLTHLFLARADGSRRFQLTQGDKSCTSPSFSPDSQFVYFLSERNAEEGKRNIWRIRIDGGEAERLTDWQGSLGVYKVSPNGKWVAFTGREKDEEKEQAKKEKRDFRVIDAKPENHGLWILPAEADPEGKREPKQVFEAGYHVRRFDWSPDSQRIAFELRPTTQVDDWTRADISEVEVATGTVRKLADTPAAEASPLYSPDGKYVVYQRTPEVARWASEGSIVLLPREGGEPKPLAPTKDQHFSSVYLLGWSRDSKSVIFSEPWGTRYVVYKAGTDGSLATVYQPDGTLGSPGVNSTGTQLGFMRESPDEPQEAYVMPLEGGAARQVSDAHGEMALPPVGKTEAIRWKSKDGLEIEGLLTYPAGYEAGHSYPLVLVIHGGPAGVFTSTFAGNRSIYPIATFASKGWAVLRANPRGSSGYGKKFRFANYDDWGGGDYEDIMAGVDHVIEMGVADPQRMVVMGWSYGGYMTSWVLTHTNRFRAAAVGAGVTNLWSFTGTSDIPGFLPDYFGGEPWEVFEAFQKHSPMSYVKGVKTPTLILHGEADVRVPTTQGYELYNALKRQGVETEMVVYPRTPHGPREPKFILDIARRHVAWVEQHLP